MNLSKPNKVEIYSYLISMPVIGAAYNNILYGERAFQDAKLWFTSFAIIFSIGIVSWFFHIQYDHFVRRKFPALNQTGKRILFKIPTNILVMTPSVLLIFFVYDYFHILGYSLQPGDLVYGYFVGLSVNLVFDTLWEVLYCLKKYKENLSEKETLEQLNTEHAFENLKSQLNPHFLFNCFNTLSSLIQEDKTEAENFFG